MAARAIAVLNGKGGVGKTITTINLSHALALEFGRRVLVVDLDPQGSLTDSLLPAAAREGVGETSSMYAVMTRRRGLREVAIRVHGTDAPQSVESGAVAREVTGSGLLDLAPADISMLELERLISGQIGFDAILRKAIAEVGDDYDLVLIDCRPSLESLEINAMRAADTLIVPISADRLAPQATARVLIPFYRQVKQELHPDLSILGALITAFDPRNTVCREAEDDVRSYFGSRVFDTKIRINTTLARYAGQAGTSIFDAEPQSRGAEDYRALAAEVLARTGLDESIERNNDGLAQDNHEEAARV